MSSRFLKNIGIASAKMFFISVIVVHRLIFVGEAVSQNITLLDQIDIPGSLTTDVWGYFDATTGKEYALVGDHSGAGLTIVDVSDPSNLVQVANVSNVPGFDVKSWQHYVYTVTGGGGGAAGIVDISDPENPQVVGSFPSAHNIFIADNGYMYLELAFNTFADLRIFDLNPDPTNPTLVWSGGTEGHDASVIGNRLYDFHGSAGTNIYDVTDPSNPQFLGGINDPLIQYHHSGCATADGRTLFICDEFAFDAGADISVWDISDVGNPQRIGEFADSEATVHNLFLIGDLAYVSYYTAGFRIFDISDPTQPVILDEFDTSLETGESFDGAFGVYPFAPSGNIYVSDIDEGLFVFNFQPASQAIFRVERSTGNVFANSFIGSGADLAERINVSEPVEPGDVVELDPTNPRHYRKARGNSQLIAGVITTEPGFILGNSNQLLVVSGQLLENEKDERPMLALLGKVPVKATTENGAIRPGDLLTVSSKPGYAMRCTRAKKCEGAIIGKAMEALESGEGLIEVLVMSH